MHPFLYDVIIIHYIELKMKVKRVDKLPTPSLYS